MQRIRLSQPRYLRFGGYEMCYETKRIQMFTCDSTTSLFTLIDATLSDPNIIAHSDWVCINRINTFRIIGFRYLRIVFQTTLYIMNLRLYRECPNIFVIYPLIFRGNPMD